MRLLDLFSGTGSVAKVAAEAGWEVVSVDICDKLEIPTHKADILSWDYRIYPVGHFDVVWASPPCTHYSQAKTQGVRDIEGSNRIVQRSLEIIRYFNPSRWFMENPDTGKLKDQFVVEGIPFSIHDYCRYGFLYRKRTRIWSNVPTESILCEGPGRCSGMTDTRHKLSCGTARAPYSEYSVPLFMKYSIPPLLIKHLFID